MGQLVSDRVFTQLLEAVLAGRYPVGEKLPRQRTLAAELGVTMSSLREALKRLEQMGIVEVRHGDAMRVRDWRERGGLDIVPYLLFRSGQVDARLLSDVFEARGLMLRDLAELAARRAQGSAADRLLELGQTLERGPAPEAAPELDFEFFAELTSLGGNLIFVLILNSIRAFYFENAAALPITTRMDELGPLYARAARAVAAGEPAVARDTIAELAALQRERVEAVAATWADATAAALEPAGDEPDAAVSEPQGSAS